MRQRPTRCTIRAGRNLPDKEFRYLRTVIVTADIHGGLDRNLSAPAFTYPHWSRVTPYASSFDLAESYVFAKQSVVPFHCGPGKPGRPFYQRYGANLPSSLRRFNSRALEYSSRIPVSVCGTGTLELISKLFLEVWHCHFPRNRSYESPSHFSFTRKFTNERPTRLDVHFQWDA